MTKDQEEDIISKLITKTIYFHMNMMVNGRMIKSMVTGYKHGQMVENIMVSGKITKDMAEEYSHGVMVNNMSVSGKTITFMGKEYLHGQILENTKVTGRMISGMGKDYTLKLMGLVMMESGKTIKNTARE